MKARRAASIPRLLPALVAALLPVAGAHAGELRAATAVVDVTDPGAALVHDPALAKVLLLERDGTRAALVTIDVVAIGGIGPIGDAFLGEVRARLAHEHGIPPDRLFVNASHCHAAVRGDVICLSHGGPICTPADAAYVNEHTDAVGFVGASMVSDVTLTFVDFLDTTVARMSAGDFLLLPTKSLVLGFTVGIVCCHTALTHRRDATRVVASGFARAVLAAAAVGSLVSLTIPR